MLPDKVGGPRQRKGRERKRLVEIERQRMPPRYGRCRAVLIFSKITVSMAAAFATPDPRFERGDDELANPIAVVMPPSMPRRLIMNERRYKGRALE